MRLLNLGCGRRVHPDWTNVDQVAFTPSVVVHDLRKPLPFASQSFDVVYHSHLLEHLAPPEARSLLLECYRILTPGGLLRIAAPDLEAIVRSYLAALEEARAHAIGAHERYSWMMLELYDQAVRTRSGGEMIPFCARATADTRAFVLARIGAEARAIFSSAAAPPPARASLGRRIARAMVSPRRWRNAAARLLLGGEYSLLQLGRFRASGEVHQWMYDDHSLTELLVGVGFVAPARRPADQSSVPDWARYGLDADAEGVRHKPDSFYFEARKPPMSVHA